MTNQFKSHMDTMAKIAGIALGFAIPISNSLTTCCVAVLLLTWCFSGIRQKLLVIFASKVTYIILALLAIYVLGTIYTPANGEEIRLMLRKMSRLLLIPIIMTIFPEAKWRKYAFYSFWVAIVFSLIIIFIKFHNICSLRLPLQVLTAKLHLLSRDTLNTAFKDRIFTGLYFSFAVFSLLHFNKEQIDNYKYQSCGKFTVWQLPISNIIYLILILLWAIYLFFYCDGRSGQLLGVGLFEVFLLQRKYSCGKFCLYNVLLVVLILGGLALGNNNSHHHHISNRYLLTIKEGIAYFTDKPHGQNNAIVNPHGQNNAIIDVLNVVPLYAQSTGLRLEFLTNSLRLGKASPWFGYGTGAFRHVYNKKFPTYIQEKQLMYHNPHNQYALTLVELGMVGLLALLAMFAVMLFESRLLPNLEKYLMQGVIFSIMVGCMANSWLLDFTSMHYFAYFVGICLAAYPRTITNISTDSYIIPVNINVNIKRAR